MHLVVASGPLPPESRVEDKDGFKALELKRSLEDKERHQEWLAQRSRAELHLWSLLRRNYLGFRFRKQYRLGPYCLDFYCPQAKLCVEVDGDWHEERSEQDKYRDETLAKNGILTVRYAADSVFLAGGEIAYKICEICKERVEAGAGRKVSIKRQFGFETGEPIGDDI